MKIGDVGRHIGAGDTADTVTFESEHQGSQKRAGSALLQPRYSLCR